MTSGAARAGRLGLVLACLCLHGGPAMAAMPRPPSPMARGVEALVGARIIVAPGREVEVGTLLVRDGLVVAAGQAVAVPDGARVRDVSGLVIWPGFLDPHVPLGRLAGRGQGEPDAGSGGPGRGGEHPALAAPASAVGHAIAGVRAEVRARDHLLVDDKTVAAFHAQGFTAAQVVPDEGILRGRGVLVSLRPGTPPAQLVVAEPPGMHVAFERSGRGRDEYPGSIMGATAVMRQALLDADWYRRASSHHARHPTAPRPETSAALEALAEVLPARPGGPGGRLVLAAGSVLDALRGGELAAEMGLGLVLVGSGDEHRRLPEVRGLGAPVVATLGFPAPPAATDADEWLEVSTRELEHWRLAPDVPRFLHEDGVAVSLTTHGMADLEGVLPRLRRMVARGLPEAAALAMLTTAPAELLGVGNRLGTLAPGRAASFILATGGPFERGTEIREAWVDGYRHVVQRPAHGPEGTWQATLRAEGATVDGRLTLRRRQGSFRWRPEGERAASGTAAARPRRASVTPIEFRHDGVTVRLEGTPLGLAGDVVLALAVDGDSLEGADAEGVVAVTARRAVGPDSDAPDDGADADPPAARPVPAGPIDGGVDVLLAGATAWTVGPAGVIEAADVLVQGGRIAAVGRGLRAPRGVKVVDLRGRHLTPGLIDAHSHVALVGGVNEGTNACTAEVRIGDAIDSESINLYRLLAGGLTTANLLHGSANPIGGQSEVIKMRWGLGPSGLRFAAAPPGIKFALGENVKQSNWGERFTSRFPQSRMGVEQFLREWFHAALDYRDEHAAWRAPGRRAHRLPPRRDLRLEALVEVLEGRRSIHCHSYRQDEILMMMRVAEEFGFRVGTFQHVLEGYKVADEIARHGAMASTFSDWWGYKFEVYDAIPQAGPLMHDRGVVVSFNSDNTELARRMHLEAAKAVKWGGLEPAEALAFVTRNAARQLGVEARVGSIEPGKDADLVAWSGPPLSTGSHVLRTWVDGRLWFDREADLAARPAAEAAREELIELARRARADGEGSEGGRAGGPRWAEVEAHCDDVDDHHDLDLNLNALAAAGGQGRPR